MARGEQPLIRRVRHPGAAFPINPAATDRQELASASSDLAAAASSPTYNKKGLCEVVPMKYIDKADGLRDLLVCLVIMAP